MGEDLELSLSEWSVLGLIAEGRSHGFSIARQLQADGAAGRVWTIPRPLVYRAIDALVERDLVQRVGSSPGEGGPRRTLLEITPEGARTLETWLTEPIEHVRDARSHLLMKLLFLDRRGTDPTLLIERQRERFIAMTKGLRAQIDTASGFDQMLLRWRLYSVETVDRFLAEITPARTSS